MANWAGRSHLRWRDGSTARRHEAEAFECLPQIQAKHAGAGGGSHNPVPWTGKRSSNESRGGRFNAPTLSWEREGLASIG
jgi:hypothetical protein